MVVDGCCASIGRFLDAPLVEAQKVVPPFFSDCQIALLLLDRDADLDATWGDKECLWLQTDSK